MLQKAILLPDILACLESSRYYRCGSIITFRESWARATSWNPRPVSASPSRWVIVSRTRILPAW